MSRIDSAIREIFLLFNIVYKKFIYLCNACSMKYTELHRLITKNGWVELPKRGKGSHKRYVKDGTVYTVPFHKGKEIGNDFAKKILQEMGIR